MRGLSLWEVLAIIVLAILAYGFIMKDTLTIGLALIPGLALIIWDYLEN